MPLQIENSQAVIDGVCGPEDALELVEWLQEREQAEIDLGRCTHLHAAALQALMSARVVVTRLPEDAFLARWLPQCMTCLDARPEADRNVA